MITRIVNESGMGFDTKIYLNDKNITKILDITSIQINQFNANDLVKATLYIEAELLAYELKNVITDFDTNLSKKELGLLIEELQNCYNNKEE